MHVIIVIYPVPIGGEDGGHVRTCPTVSPVRLPMAMIPCFGCGAQVPDIDGPVHAYMASTPGCWQTYGEVLAAEYGDVTYWPAHQLTVDAYAVQHPTNPDRRNRQSVAVHLISLHLVLERDVAPQHAPKARSHHVKRHRATGFPWMDPPPCRGTVTVADVVGAANAEEHFERVRRWADAAWQAWASHHSQVRAWAADSTSDG